MDALDRLQHLSITLNDFLYEDCNWKQVYKQISQNQVISPVIVSFPSPRLVKFIEAFKSVLSHDIKPSSKYLYTQKPLETLMQLLSQVHTTTCNVDTDLKIDIWIFEALKDGVLLQRFEAFLNLNLAKHYKQTSILLNAEHVDSIRFLFKYLHLVSFSFVVEDLHTEAPETSSLHSESSVRTLRKTKKRIVKVTSIESVDVPSKVYVSSFKEPASFSLSKSYSLREEPIFVQVKRNEKQDNTNEPIPIVKVEPQSAKTQRSNLTDSNPNINQNNNRKQNDNFMEEDYFDNFKEYSYQLQVRTLSDQDFKCYNCNTPIFESLFCNYTRSHYCKKCHANQISLIPALVMFNLDFNTYPVCIKSYQELQSLEKSRFDLSKVNPKLLPLLTCKKPTIEEMKQEVARLLDV